VFTTDAPDDARKMAAAAAESGEVDTILVTGGDGTVNEVVTGIIESGTGPDRLTLGIVPTGTCNVLANEIGMPELKPTEKSIDETLAIIRAGKTRVIDVGKANDKYFTLVAGFGFDAAAVAGVEKQIKDLVGAPAYVLSMLKTLTQYKPSRIHIKMDDAVLETDAYAVIVANVSTYAFEAIKIAPFAAMDDGVLDICIFEQPSAQNLGFAAQLLLALARRHLDHPRVRYYRARHAELVSVPPIFGQLDGDLATQTPVTIDVTPQALRVIVG
jgi:diacylglycerol kinase (ATP)